MPAVLGASMIVRLGEISLATKVWPIFHLQKLRTLVVYTYYRIVSFVVVVAGLDGGIASNPIFARTHFVGCHFSQDLGFQELVEGKIHRKRW